MDFFNYAGIQRPVKLYTTPYSVHLDDITMATTLQRNGSAMLNYTLVVIRAMFLLVLVGVTWNLDTLGLMNLS